jgi:hypothetical protein
MAMLVSVSTSGLKLAKWYEYVIRFVLGGLVTALAGLLAKKFGPSFGGLFLAFPAIFAASTSLIEKHERERKEEMGSRGTYRGRQAAGADAVGAAMGSIGLVAFAVAVWKLLPEHDSPAVILGGTLIWGSVAVGVWYAWKRKLLRRLRKAVSRISNRQS